MRHRVIFYEPAGQGRDVYKGCAAVSGLDMTFVAVGIVGIRVRMSSQPKIQLARIIL